jgi:hypothetical protein
MEDNVMLAMATLSGTIWGVTEGLANAWKRISKAFGHPMIVPKDLFALILGPLMGVIWFRQGYLPIGETAVGWAYFTAALYGLMGTFGATLVNDKMVRPTVGNLGKE